jgi:hypothetical protein
VIIFVGVQFRAAISLQFDFHRAIYNLGTVLVRISSLKQDPSHPPVKYNPVALDLFAITTEVQTFV